MNIKKRLNNQSTIAISKRRTGCKEENKRRESVMRKLSLAKISDNKVPVIRLPRDCPTIMRQIGARRTNHDRLFCYIYD